MKVRELIQLLEKHDPEVSVLISSEGTPQSTENVIGSRMCIQHPFKPYMYDSDSHPTSLSSKDWESLKRNTKTHKLILITDRSRDYS